MALYILGNPEATSRDDVIFSGKSLLKELKSPWELSLTEPLPEVVEFCTADWAEKYFSAQSARSSSWVTLSPSYTKQFSSSINLVAWPLQREGCRGEFQKKIFNEAKEIASLNMGARNQYSSIIFLGRFIKGISYIFIPLMAILLRDFWFGAIARTRLFPRLVDIVVWPVQLQFAYRAKFQKLFNDQGEIRSNLEYSPCFPRKQKQQCRNHEH